MLYPTELRDHAAAHIASRGRFAKRIGAGPWTAFASGDPAHAASAVSASRTQ